MKKILSNILALFVVTILAITGCMPDKAEEALKYQGASVAEIKNHSLGKLAALLTAQGYYTTTAQTDSTRTVLLNTKGADTIFVQLVGPQVSTAQTLDFNVRASSTAVEGTNYNFVPTGTRKVTIPANSSVGYIITSLIPNSIATVGTSRILAIDLVGNTALPVNPNYNKFILTMRR